MDPSVFVSTRDLALGLARRECPECHALLLVRLPSMADANSDAQSAAIRLDLADVLTITEQRVFDVVYSYYPHAVATAVAAAAAYGMAAGGIRTHLNRMRPKLAAKGWSLRTRHGTLRLAHEERQK